MNILTIRAVVHFVTPGGELVKYVNWTGYEEKAGFTASTSSQEAFNKFLISAKEIVNASKVQLRYLKTIWFYEEKRALKGTPKKTNPTLTIIVGDNMDHLEVAKEYC